MTEDEARLLELLRTHAHKRGTFTLASGKTSDFFIDCKRVLLRAEGHWLAGRALLARLGSEVQGVAGVELGGCPLASAVAFASAEKAHREHGFAALDALYVRKVVKDHGSRQTIEGADALAKGASVALLEDVVTTGGSSLRALDQLKAAGLPVTRVIAVVDRLEGGREAFVAAGVSFEVLFTRADFA